MQIREIYEKYKEIVRYLIVGGLTTLVSLAVYYALVLTVLDPQKALQLQAANVIAWIASVTFAYVTNRKYVFESRSPQIAREAAAFFAARIGTLLMDMAIMFLGTTVLGFSDKIVKLIVQVVVIVMNYVLSKLWVFRRGGTDRRGNRQ